MILKNWDWKYIFLFLSFCVTAVFAYVFRSEVVHFLKLFFEFPQLNLCAGGISAILTIVHKIKLRKFTFSPTMSFNEFKIPMEDILSFVSNPITIICSLSLAKGLFLQTSENQQYFPFFNNIETSFIFIVTVYLLFISFMEMAKNFRECFIKSKNKVATPQAITEQEFNTHESEK